jgi:hypothetical protein
MNKKILLSLITIAVFLVSSISFSQTLELGSLSTFEDFTKMGAVTTTAFPPFYSTYFVKTKDANALTRVDYSFAIEGSDIKSSTPHYNGSYSSKIINSNALTIVDYSFAIEGSDIKSSTTHYNGLYSSKIINSVALTIVDYSFAIDAIEDSYTPLQVVGVATHFGNVKVNDTIYGIAVTATNKVVENYAQIIKGHKMLNTINTI